MAVTTSRPAVLRAAALRGAPAGSADRGDDRAEKLEQSVTHRPNSYVPALRLPWRVSNITRRSRLTERAGHCPFDRGRSRRCALVLPGWSCR